MGNKIWGFVRWHFEPRHFTTPLATTNHLLTVEVLEGGRGAIVRGQTHIFIFGVRVACIQRTVPWEK
ncbi:hypothetical protein [Microbulbifer sp. VAAF005]|uniref:hypothetical protein n=1 Tax=Microbulbifer sp. VAAF005 TaxID=3034230 RepID=UPI0024ACAFAA|nr:hypothetical protein [Microbulbifer sp. VAAF005]WHI46815.1 hypothetical protein P0078_00115 [Microbulbifer sp. VAAF005]